MTMLLFRKLPVYKLITVVVNDDHVIYFVAIVGLVLACLFCLASLFMGDDIRL